MAYDPNVLRRASARLEEEPPGGRASCSGRPMPRSPGWPSWTDGSRAPWPSW